jgi:hypothetical protein
MSADQMDVRRVLLVGGLKDLFELHGTSPQSA